MGVGGREKNYRLLPIYYTLIVYISFFLGYITQVFSQSIDTKKSNNLMRLIIPNLIIT